MNEANGLNPGEAGLSEGAAKFLGVSDGEILSFSHLGSLDSMGDVRRKIYGHELDQPAYDRIISDIVDLDLSNVQLSAFITACAGDRMTLNEIVALTRSMIDSGQKIDWGPDPVFDKHSIGGLPGNRTTPIVVAIVAAAGLKIPKTIRWKHLLTLSWTSRKSGRLCNRKAGVSRGAVQFSLVRRMTS